MRRDLTKNTHNKYKAIIMDKLAHNDSTAGKKNHSHIHSLKTQCTPNDRTQDFCQRLFEDFQSNFQVKYKPILLPNKPKPVRRCLYPELLELSKSSTLTT